MSRRYSRQGSRLMHSYVIREFRLNSELNGPHFIFQQTTFNILPPHNSITIKCIGETVGDDLIQYQWYQSIDGSIESKEKIEEGVNESSLTLFASDFEKPGIYYYYCGIKSIINNDEKTIISDEVLSDVIIIAYTGLPTVLVETYDGINPSSHKEKKTGKLMVFYPNGEVYDSDNSNNGKFTIHVRGNATANHPKAPYKIKLPENFNLLDPTSSKNRDREWVLLSNYTDKTLIRTKLGFFVSGMFNSIKENEDLYVCDSKFVDLIMNGEYVGTYILADQVKEGEDRLDINLNEWDFGSVGYVAEFEPVKDRAVKEIKWFKTSLGMFYYSFKFPHIDDEMFDYYMKYLEKYMNDFENALYNDENWYDYIDLESFARFFLVHNILANLDTNYFFSKKDMTNVSKIKMGPAWDFEWSVGIGWYDGERPRNPDYICLYGWYFQELLEKQLFIEELQKQWKKLKGAYPELAKTIISKMEEYAAQIEISQKVNFMRWPILNEQISVGAIPLNSYEAELKCDEQFLEARVLWLNRYINGDIIPVPFSYSDCIGLDCEETIEKLKKMGFTNIELISENGEVQNYTKNYVIAQITVDERNDFNKGSTYGPDVKISILAVSPPAS